jgi:hypothetical protein
MVPFSTASFESGSRRRWHKRQFPECNMVAATVKR